MYNAAITACILHELRAGCEPWLLQGVHELCRGCRRAARPAVRHAHI